MADFSSHPTICPACGYPLKPGLEACPNCGEIPGALPVDVDPIETVPPVVPPRPSAGNPTLGKKKPRVTVLQQNPTPSLSQVPQSLWMILGVAVVAAFIAGYLIGSGGSTGPASVSAPAAPGSTGPAVDLAKLNSLRSAVEADPANTQALLTYANALHDSRMFDQAIVAYNSYLEKIPDDPNARVDLGVIYFEMQDYAKAKSLMLEAVQKHPDHQLGLYNLGIVTMNMGNTAEARSWFTKAKDLDPANEIGQQSASQLSTLK